MLGCSGYVEWAITRTEEMQHANRIGYPSGLSTVCNLVGPRESIVRDAARVLARFASVLSMGARDNMLELLQQSR
jgi:hypothetical protein